MRWITCRYTCCSPSKVPEVRRASCSRASLVMPASARSTFHSSQSSCGVGCYPQSNDGYSHEFKGEPQFEVVGMGYYDASADTLYIVSYPTEEQMAGISMA